ncbi:MAG: hypothetical protein HYV97_07485 [Bdellovibrio sp.]|nr:hypothetical protein [Bdellovibrio sp.]
MDKPWRRKFLSMFRYPRVSQIYILPTRQGLYYLLGTFLGIIFALIYGNPLGIFFIFLWFVVLLIAAIITQQTLAKTRSMDWLMDWRWNENSTAEFKSDFDNEMCNISLQLNDRQDFLSLKTPGLIAPGVHTVQAIRLTSMAPLGIFQAWTYLTIHKEIMVLPCPKDYAVKRPPLGRKQSELSNSILTNFESSTPGYPIVLDSLDSGARIHWRRMAASDQLVGIRPEISISEGHTLVLEDIALSGRLEKIRQALFWLQQNPKSWNAVEMPNGEHWCINNQLLVRLTYYLSSLRPEHRGIN